MSALLNFSIKNNEASELAILKSHFILAFGALIYTAAVLPIPGQQRERSLSQPHFGGHQMKATDWRQLENLGAKD